MAKRTSRDHSPTFKAQEALAALKCDKMLAEFAQQLDTHPDQTTGWKAQLVRRAAKVFGAATVETGEPDLKTLRARIGQLTLENILRQPRSQRPAR